MKSFKSYQQKRILMSDGTIANGDFILDDGLTIRVKDGFLNDVADPDGYLLPAISTADATHIEHWRMGVLHCESEPAIVDAIDNYEEWWIDGKESLPKESSGTKEKPAPIKTEARSDEGGAQRRVYAKPVLDLQATGKKLKFLIEEKGLSKPRIQKILGFPNVQTVYNWFRGRNMPTLDNLVALAKILDVKMDDIVVTNSILFEYDA